MSNLREKLGLKKPKTTVASGPVGQGRLPTHVDKEAAGFASGPKPKTGKPLVFGTEWVTASCGHPVLFEIYDPAKDKYREQRRLKVTGRICPACREAQQAKEMAEAKERRKLKNAERARREEQDGQNYRLPDESVFYAKYYTHETQWEGTLTVKVEGGNIVFASTKSGVFGLMRDLDRQYRSWVIHQNTVKHQEHGG